MEALLEILPVIIYILLIVLLVVGIILGIKAIITLNKVEKIVDEVTEKFESLNPIFNIIDFASDRLASLTDTVFEFFTGLLGKLISRKDKGEDK